MTSGKIPFAMALTPPRNSRASVLPAGFCDGSRRQCVRYAKSENHRDTNSRQIGARQTSDSAENASASRRCFISSSIVFAATCIQNFRASAADEIPPGFDLYEDSDGFTFTVPDGWSQVRGAGSSVFFRNPADIEENVIVDVSSPSSSRYKGIEELGTPEEAAKRILKQYLSEFMSTRIGVQRESSIVSANSRIAPDGHLLYEVVVNVKSFANNNQMAVMPSERVVKLEWSRLYYSVLGVENKRLYQLRLQTPERALERDAAEFRQIMDSFTLRKLIA